LFDGVRFDLIFLMLDPEDELFDRKLASHLVSLYYKGSEQEEQELLVRLCVVELVVVVVVVVVVHFIFSCFYRN